MLPLSELWRLAPDMIPIEREVKLSFHFNTPSTTSTTSIQILDQINQLTANGKFEISGTTCSGKGNRFWACSFSHSCLIDAVNWGLCQSFEEHLTQLSKSTFSLIVADDHNGIGGHTDRLVEALLSGAVPIILSYSGAIPLPLDQVIDWRNAAIQVPFGRLPELPFMIGSLTPGRNFWSIFLFILVLFWIIFWLIFRFQGHIFGLRRHGRFILEEYFSSIGRIVFSAVEALRHRVGIVPRPYQQITQKDYPIPQYYQPTLPAEPNFLDEETKEEFVTLQEMRLHTI